MTRTPTQALAWADQHDSGFNGLCLVYVREAYDVAAKYPTAAAAWDAAQHRHVGAAAVASAPAGAIVHMHKPGEKPGHVGLKTTDGRFRSTDSAHGAPHTTDLAYWTRAGYVIDGWAEDVNGVRIPGLAPAKPAAKPAAGNAAKAGLSTAQVKALQRGLNKAFPAYSKLAVDGSYGPKTAAVVTEFQRRNGGLVTDGIAGPHTQAALKKYGVTL